MSAEANVVFYGIRIPISESEVEAIDPRRHPLVLKAKAAGLSFHLSNFGGSEPLYYLFLGKPLGVTGAEHEAEVVVPTPKLRETIALVRDQLPKAGFTEEPSLFIQWVPDA